MTPDGGEGEGGEPAALRIPDDRLVGRPTVILLDVDGTLAPIAPTPALAAVPEATRRTIAALAARDDVSVALVSGRAAHDARRMVAVDNVWTIGNHGAEVMTPSGELSVDPDVARYGPGIEQTARALAPVVAPFRDVILEHKGWTLSVHYRAADPAVVPGLEAAVADAARRNGLRLTAGKMLFEVRPPVQVDKGTAVYGLARELGALGDDAAVLFAGDDVTDEDAFRLLRSRVPRAVTVHVGDSGDTAAEFRLATTADVHALLLRVARLLSVRQ